MVGQALKKSLPVLGSGAGQFDFDAGDTTDFFPKEFGVDKDGHVVIPDEGNKRIVIYNSNGTIKILSTSHPAP